MNKKTIIIIFIIGMILICSSQNISSYITDNIVARNDGMDTNMYYTYLINYASMFRCIGVVLSLPSLFILLSTQN